MKRNVVYIDDPDYDFGVIADSIHVLNHFFVLHNSTDDTCYIRRIVKSCGCTKVYSNKTFVPPNDTLRIQVEIDLGNNYSYFEKDINVYTSSSDTPLTVYVRASREMPKDVINRQFPVPVSDHVRLSSPGIILGYIQHGQAVTKSINIINTSQSDVYIEGSNHNLPSNLTVFIPEIISPNTISRIVAIYDATETEELWGEQEFVITVKEKGGEAYPITIYGILTDSFDNRLQNTPRIYTPVTCYQLEPNETDTSWVSRIFVIGNIGEGDLIIRDIDVDVDHGIRYNLQKTSINPNDSTYLAIAVSQSVLEDKQAVKFGISSNDRIEPYKVLKVIK